MTTEQSEFKPSEHFERLIRQREKDPETFAKNLQIADEITLKVYEQEKRRYEAWRAK
jgi:hypothetical protein